MNFGFESFGEEGRVQIDSFFINHSLVEKRTLTSTSYLNESAVYLDINTSLYSSPIIALRCTQIVGLISITPLNSTTVRYTYLVGSSGSETVQFYIFDKVNASSIGKYGLQTYNENSQIVFDSNDKHIRVEAMFAGNDFMNTNPAYDSLSYDSNTKLLAAAITAPSWYSQSYFQGTRRFWMCYVATATPSLPGDFWIGNVSWVAGSGTIVNTRGYSVLAIDVMGY